MIRGIKPRELSALYQAAERQGATVVRTRNNHIRVAMGGAGCVIGPGTASDHRAVLNTRALLRRLGLTV